MTDYGRDLEFGVSVVPLADPPGLGDAHSRGPPTAQDSTSSASRITHTSGAFSIPGRSSRRSCP